MSRDNGKRSDVTVPMLAVFFFILLTRTYCRIPFFLIVFRVTKAKLLTHQIPPHPPAFGPPDVSKTRVEEVIMSFFARALFNTCFPHNYRPTQDLRDEFARRAPTRLGGPHVRSWLRPGARRGGLATANQGDQLWRLLQPSWGT